MVDSAGPTALFVVLLLVSCALPLAIGLFLTRRHYPSIRYASPHQTAVCSSFAAILSVGTSAMLLSQDSVSCGSFNVFIYLFTNAGFFGLCVTQLTLVLTFHLTQQLALHNADTKVGEKAKAFATIQRLRRLLTPHSIVAKWVVGNLVWFLPPLAAVDAPLVTNMQSTSIANCLAVPMNVVMNGIILLQILLFIVALVVLSLYLSKVIDNFGLRRHYQVMSRVLASLLCLECLCVVFHTADVVAAYRLRYVVLPLGGIAVVGCQVVWPLLQSRHEAPISMHGHEDHSSKLAVLEDFLATDDGLAAFSAFARLEFSLENVVAWKAAFEFKKKGGGDAYAIYSSYMSVGAAMETNIPDALRQHYHDIFIKHHRRVSQGGRTSTVASVIADNDVQTAINQDPAVFDA
ncbi:hypothetical protein As57867_002163, partial [Aphanomyces stellatus]